MRNRGVSQAFFEFCFVVAPGACSKTDATLLPLGFFDAAFFGFLASRPDRFCPFATATSTHDHPRIIARPVILMLRPLLGSEPPVEGQAVTTGDDLFVAQVPGMDARLSPHLPSEILRR